MSHRLAVAPSLSRSPTLLKNRGGFLIEAVEVNHLRLHSHGRVQIFDIRSADDYARGHVPGAINVHEGAWTKFRGMRMDMNNIFYSGSAACPLGRKAAAYFAGKGFLVMEMKGGFEYWKKHHLPIEHATRTQKMRKKVID